MAESVSLSALLLPGELGVRAAGCADLQTDSGRDAKEVLLTLWHPSLISKTRQSSCFLCSQLSELLGFSFYFC